MPSIDAICYTLNGIVRAEAKCRVLAILHQPRLGLAATGRRCPTRRSNLPPPPTDSPEIFLRQEAALMAGQPRERAGSGETATRRLSAAAATLSERCCRSAEPRTRFEYALGALADLLCAQYLPVPEFICGTHRTGFGAGYFSFARTPSVFGILRAGVFRDNRMKALPASGSVRRRGCRNAIK